MRKLVLTSLATVALAGSAFALDAFAAADAPETPSLHGMQDRGFLLDARLAGMKAALALSADQEKLWAPFETAVRDAYKARRDAMRQMRERMREEGPPSPIERLNAISDHLAKASGELKMVADAAKPLYDGLDDMQKRRFGPLLRTLRPEPAEMHGGQRHHEDGGDER
jgi:LTXXQ motif family protein